MLNLGRNATKFVDSGFIRMRAIVVEHEENGGVIMQLCVEDSGKGIPPDKRQDLFQKFKTNLHIL
jgi:signal transduction histidine kinase